MAWNCALPSPTIGKMIGVSLIRRAWTLANSSCGPQIIDGRMAVQFRPDLATYAWAIPLLRRNREGESGLAPFWLILMKCLIPAFFDASTTFIVPCGFIGSSVV